MTPERPWVCAYCRDSGVEVHYIDRRVVTRPCRYGCPLKNTSPEVLTGSALARMLKLSIKYLAARHRERNLK